VEFSSDVMERGIMARVGHRRVFSAFQLYPVRTYDYIGVGFSLLMGNASHFERCESIVGHSAIAHSVRKIVAGDEYLFGAAMGSEDRAATKPALQLFEDKV